MICCTTSLTGPHRFYGKYRGIVVTTPTRAA